MNALERGFTEVLARRAAHLHYSDLSADVRMLVRQSLLDYLGVTLAGVAEPQARIVADEMIAQGGHADATIFGRDVRVPGVSASLANGTAAHALDFDDVNMAIPGHPAAAIFPAALAAAEETKSSGKALMEAYVAGYDTMCLLGLAMGVEHYDAGFHATATLGSLGAAAACGRLYGLSDAAMAHALGLAMAQTAGFKSMFGTMTKPFNAGRAAANGLLAVRLVHRGFESRIDAVESKGGMAALMNARFNAEVAFDRSEPGDFLRSNLFKFHVACYLVHAAIEAASDLRSKHSLDVEQIETVSVRADESLDGVCNIRDPWDSMSAKFSLRAATALSLLGRDTASPRTFDTYMSDARARALAECVEVSLVRGRSKNDCDVSVQMVGGANFSCTRDSSVPNRDLERQGAALRRKFDALMEPILDKRDRSEIVGAVDSLDSLGDVALLARFCSRTARSEQ